MDVFKFRDGRVHFRNCDWVIRRSLHICGFYRRVNSGISLTNWIKPDFYEWFANVYTSIKSTKIKIHSLKFQFCHQTVTNVAKKVYLFRRRKENRSDGFLLWTLYNVNIFLQPIKLREMFWKNSYRKRWLWGTRCLHRLHNLYHSLDRFSRWQKKKNKKKKQKKKKTASTFMQIDNLHEISKSIFRGK